MARGYNITLLGTRWQPKPVFVLGSDREIGGMIGSSHDVPLVYTAVTLLEFIKSAFNQMNWLYWTGELSDWEDELQSEGTARSPTGNKGWEAFRIIEENFASNENESNASLWRPMLWLSHPGVVAQTHFDTQHNLFIQVQGIKRFLLFPPDTELHSYPNIHRSYRQSQIHFEKDSSSSSSTTASISPSAKTSAWEIVFDVGCRQVDMK